MAEAAASHPDAETLTGRGRVHVVPAPVDTGGSSGPIEGARPAPGGSAAGARERWVVRHYLRGGAMAPILGDRYLRVGTPRPFREYRLGRTLEDRGLPVTAHLGAAVYPSGVWYRGDLVTRHVPGSVDLAGVLFPRSSAAPGRRDALELPDREAAVLAAGRLFRLLHDDGVVHPDLNLKNVLIAPSGGGLEALALDLDGARLVRRAGGGARRRMIQRFWRSARKWEAATGMALADGLADAFRAGYGE